VVGAVAVKRKTTTILVVAEHGYGKRSELDEYRISHRGGKGVFTIKATEKTGPMVAIKEVLENDDIVVVTTQGVIIRQPAKTIRLAGRNTQGVRLIRLEPNDRIAAIAVVPTEEEKEETAEPREQEAPKKPPQPKLTQEQPKKAPPAAPKRKKKK
jgi:DNA gyrase subunit A